MSDQRDNILFPVQLWVPGRRSTEELVKDEIEWPLCHCGRSASALVISEARIASDVEGAAYRFDTYACGRHTNTLTCCTILRDLAPDIKKILLLDEENIREILRFWPVKG